RTERALYFFGRLLVRSFYRVTALGLENLPGGGFLLVPNHITWVDALLLQLACPRPIRYVIDQAYYHRPILHPILRALGCIPLNAEAADVATVREELLKLGESCFSRRPSLDRHLAEECVRGLKRRPFATAVIDGTDYTQLSRSKLLGAAAALSRYLRKEFS